jgi:3-oxoacyl-[acyl-carrier protein] reductase
VEKIVKISDDYLKGRTALVLGAVKGIGKEIGLALARQGVKLALNYYDWEDSLDQMKKDFQASGADHLIIRTDLTDTDAVSGLIAKTTDHFKRLDILINNIERGGWPVVHGPYNQAQWDLEFATTLRAKWWVFNAALPWLKASGNGVVINISSIAGIVGRSGPASMIFNDGYAAANRGISLLTETWAKLGAPEVRVNELMLGFFDTRHGPCTRGWGLLTETQKQALTDHTLLKRIGSPEDIVSAVLFMIRDAPFMTGSVLRLDGGYVIGGGLPGPMPPGVL